MGKHSKYHPYKKQQNQGGHSKNSNSGTLPIGIKGFLCTFNTMRNQSENQCVKEAYNILNEYLEKINASDTKDPNKKETSDVQEKITNDELDVEEELKNELHDLQNEDVKKRKFQKLDSGAQGNVFIKINDKTIDPVTLGTGIVEDLHKTKQQKTIHLLRLIPVEVTCKSYVDDITKAIGPLLDKYFLGAPTSYCIVFNKRNNNNLERASVIELTALLVKEKNMFHSVDLKQAALTIVFEVIKSVCCISVLPDYYKYMKYNLSMLTYPTDKALADDKPMQADVEPSETDEKSEYEVKDSDGAVSGEEKEETSVEDNGKSEDKQNEVVA
uniref:THUMP domain-containing protein 1 homolog n=1 Tax=Cacopsylla melanoneura TaxID=428564 RepID=A0A8D9B3W1_9HEMI